MPKKPKNVIVQAILSIPRAGEIIVNVPLPEDLFLDPPTAEQLRAVVAEDLLFRACVKLARGEHKRVRGKFGG